MYKLLMNLLLAAVFGLAAVAADTCVKHGPCTCQLNNGSWIDLRVLSNPVVPSFQYLKFSTATSLYSWSPCVDIMYGKPSNGDDCTPGVAVCENYLGTGEAYFNWGDQNSVEYKVDGNGAVSLLYSHNGRTTTVILDCREHTQNQVVVDDATAGTLTLRLISHCSCADTCAINHGEAGIPNGPTYRGALFKDPANNDDNSDSADDTSPTEKNTDKNSSKERKGGFKYGKKDHGSSTSKPDEDQQPSNAMNTNFAALKAVDPDAGNSDAVNSGGLSAGAIIGVTLFALVAVYVVGGMALKRSLTNARGMEMIPNYSFWTGVAGSIRSGTSYLLNGCRSSYTYDSY